MVKQSTGSAFVGALVIGGVLVTSTIPGCSSSPSCQDTRTCDALGGVASYEDGGEGGEVAGVGGSAAENAGAGGARDLDAAGAGGAAGSAGAAEHPALTLTIAPIVRVRRGGSVDVNVNVTRIGTASGAIKVTIDGLPAGVGAQTLSLSEAQAAGTFKLKALQSAAVGGPTGISITAVDADDAALSNTAGATLFVSGAPAEADESFGVAGSVVHSFTTREDYVQDLAIDARDRIVLAGAGEGVGPWIGWAARLLPNGVLDPEFGIGGQVANFGPTSTTTSADKVAIIGDDAVFAISSGNAGGTYFLRKLTENGTAAPGFGTGGDVILPDGLRALLHRERGLLALTFPEFKLYAYADSGAADLSFKPPANVFSIALATDRNNRILFGGAAAQDGDFTVTRLTADGALDSSFGKSGTATVQATVVHKLIRVSSVIAVPDGRTVFLGDAQFGAYDQSRVSLFRLDSKGAIDSAFGTGGELMLTPEGLGLAAILQDDGKVVALYADRLPNELLSCALARIGEDGKLDLSFAVSGVLKLACPDDIYYEQPGNRLLIVDHAAEGIQLKRIWL